MTIKSPVPASSWNFIPNKFAPDTWFFNVDNPGWWGNNVEASTSCGFKRPRKEFLKSSPTPTSPTVMMYLDDHSINQKIVPYDQDF
jgi:hypothetical protein